MTTDGDRKYTISAVEKTMHILESLASEGAGATLAQLSTTLGMPKPTLFRYLTTLQEMGYVQKDPSTDGYTLGLKAFELGNLAMPQRTVREIALPEMHSLLDRFSETVNLGIMDRGQVLYLEILESPQAMKMSARVGSRDYAHATSLGKAMLAFMPDEEVETIVQVHGLPARTEKTITTFTEFRQELVSVRRRGYAIDTGENEPTARCVGAPIFDRFGQVAAAMSLSGPAHRLSDQQVEAVGRALTQAASRISQRIGYSEG